MARLKLPYATSAVLDAATPEEREIIFDTTNDEIRIGDGATLGGKRLSSGARQRTFNVDDYGADPTGVSTSNTGIDTAFDLLLAAGSGTLRFKPGGIYKIDGSSFGTTLLSALNLRRVLIATEGCRFTCTTDFGDGQFFNFLRFEGCEFWEVQDFEWVGSPTAAYTAQQLNNRGVRLISSRNTNGGGRIGRIAGSGGAIGTGVDLFRTGDITNQCYDLFIESLDMDRVGYPLAVRNSGRGISVGRIRCNEVHRPIIAYGFRDLTATVERYSNGAGVDGESQLHIMTNGDGSNIDQDDDISSGVRLTLRGGPAPRDTMMVSFECRGTSAQQLRDIHIHLDLDMDSAGSTSQRVFTDLKRSDASTTDTTTRGHKFDLTVSGEVRGTPVGSTWAQFCNTSNGDWVGEDVRLRLQNLIVRGSAAFNIDCDGFTAEGPIIENCSFPSAPTLTGTRPTTMREDNVKYGSTLIARRFPNTGLKVRDSNDTHDLTIAAGSNLTADRQLTLTTGDANRTLDISAADVTVSSAAATVLDDTSVRAMCMTLAAPHVIAKSAASLSGAADTNENTLVTVALPALGANDSVRVTMVWTLTNNGNAKTIRVDLGGTDFYSNSFASTALVRVQTEIHNRNATNSQVGHTISAGFGTSSGAISTGTVDTSQARSLTITCQKATDTDTMTLEYYVVELMRAA